MPVPPDGRSGAGTGAELEELDAVAGALREVAERLRDLQGALGPLVAEVGRATGAARARRACDVAGEGLVPALRGVREAVQRLGDDASGQAYRFRIADGAG